MCARPATSNAAEIEEAQDRLLLLVPLQLLERSGQMATCSQQGCTTCPVVPVEGRVQDDRPAFGEADQQPFNEQPVVEDNQLRCGRHLDL